MISHLLFPFPLRKAHLSSATSQAGFLAKGYVPGAANVGKISVVPRGTGSTSAIIALTGSGDLETCTYKFSSDGGANYKGRQAITTWDGNGAASRTPYDGASGATAPTDCGALFNADLDGDGAGETLFATATLSTGLSLLYSSPSIDGTGAWTLVSSVAPRYIVWHESGKMFGVRVIDPGTDDGIGVYASGDNGVTWNLSARITTHAQAGGLGNIIRLMSGKLALVYSRTISGDDSIILRTSADGVNWSDECIYTEAGKDLVQPWIAQTQGGVTLCVYLQNTATVGIEMITYANADPADDTPVPTTLTMFAADANHSNPTVTISPDGTVIIVVRHATSAKIQYSYLKGASGTFPAVATLLDTGDTLSTPKVCRIGGALYCTYVNGTTYNVELVMSKYWTTYAAGLESWTGSAVYPQWLHGSTWVTFGGYAGVLGDTLTLDSDAEYGAHRVSHGRPRQAARSIADAADWAAVFDAGANGLIPIDTICVGANVGHCHVEANATDSWGAPTLAQEMSLVRQTIAAANRTLSTCEMTLTAGSLTPHRNIGERLRFATSGEVFLISDNDATKVWCQEQDIDGATGDAQILASKAWAAVTQVNLRFLRLLIENQQTYENYYEVMLAVGLRTAFTGLTSLKPSTGITGADTSDDGGGTSRNVRGPMRRSWVLSLYMLGAAKYHELRQRIVTQGSAPFVLIPDSTDPYDWAWVQPELETQWVAKTTTIKLLECV